MFQKQNEGEIENYLKFINNQTSLYNLEILSEKHDDFQLINTSFRITSSCCLNDLKIERICRVHPKHPTKKKEDIKSDNILLFHGTSHKNVPGILLDGFKSSKTGRFGPGVYHSNFFSMCQAYGKNKYNLNDDSYFYFINEIPRKYLTKIREEDYNGCKKLPEFYCHKYLSNQNHKELYVPDSNGSFINIAEDDTGAVPMFVASSNIVIPKYLVHAKHGMEELVNSLLSGHSCIMFKLILYIDGNS